MTRPDVEPSKTDTSISVNDLHTEHEKTELSTHEYAKPKPSCETHSTPLIDRELQTPRGQEALHILSAALNDLGSKDRCTRCTVENLVPFLESHLKDLKLAKHNGEWSKEDRKALKAETKSLFRPIKKSLKKFMKGE